LTVRGAFQSVNGICFYIDQKELTPELLFKVGPGLDGKDASVCLLVKEILRLLHGSSILEESKGPEDLFLVTAELLWGQVQV